MVVNGGAQAGEDVLSVIVAVGGYRDAGSVIRDSDGRIGDQRAALVGHDAANLRGL